MTSPPKDPKPRDSQDKAAGQIVAELAKFGGFNKEQSSRLARILLRLLNQNYLPKTDVEAAIGENEYPKGTHMVGVPGVHRDKLRQEIRTKLGLHKKGVEDV